MMAEYDQRHNQNGYQKYGQNGYQHYDQRGYQQHDQRGQQQYDQRNYPQYDQRGYQNHDQRDQQPYDTHDQQQSQARSTILERGRAIRLMRNGDPFFTGRNFVINQKKYPMLGVFLDDASKTLRANFGAVRCIYTPKHGTRVHDISDFEDHQTYVAAGGEKFKKLHYLDIAEGKRISSKGHSSPKNLLPPVRRNDVEGRALKLSRSENVIIYVYRNGDPLTLPAKVLLVKSTLQSWESVLDEITKKVVLPNTAVLKLYAMNGELITSARQIEYNGMYVAAGKERFKRIKYPDPQLISPNASPKMSRKSVRLPTKLPPIQRRTDGTDAHNSVQPTSSLMKYRYAKSDGANTYTNTANSYGSTENPAPRRPAYEEYDFFNNKPQQHRRGPTKETDLDRDDGGIYKGRLNHRDRAREVDETRDTKVDIPIDYREAETVEEESLYGNTRKNADRHHQQKPHALPPPSPPPPHNQPYADSRQLPIKSQPKTYDDDEDYQFSYSNNRSNGYDNDYHRRTETPIDDDQTEEQLPHSSFRQPLISSSTQTQYDDNNHEDNQEQDLESNIDQKEQSFAAIERGLNDDNYKA